MYELSEPKRAAKYTPPPELQRRCSTWFFVGGGARIVGLLFAVISRPSVVFHALLLFLALVSGGKFFTRERSEVQGDEILKFWERKNVVAFWWQIFCRASSSRNVGKFSAYSTLPPVLIFHGLLDNTNRE